MKNKALVPLAIAVICGVAATFLILKVGVGSPEKKVAVLRAKDDLSPQSRLDKVEEMFYEDEIPESALKKDLEAKVVFPSKNDYEKLKGRFLKNGVTKNNPLKESDLLQPGENPMVSKLKPGETAHTVKVSLEKAGGFITPGSRVNILATDAEGQKVNPRFLLRDMEVLAINDRLQAQSAGGSSDAKAQAGGYLPPEVAVLRIDKNWKSLALTRYQAKGTIYLTLRGEAWKELPADQVAKLTGDDLTRYQAGKEKNDTEVKLREKEEEKIMKELGVDPEGQETGGGTGTAATTEKDKELQAKIDAFQKMEGDHKAEIAKLQKQMEDMRKSPGGIVGWPSKVLKQEIHVPGREPEIRVIPIPEDPVTRTN